MKEREILTEIVGEREQKIIKKYIQLTIMSELKAKGQRERESNLTSGNVSYTVLISSGL